MTRKSQKTTEETMKGQQQRDVNRQLKRPSEEFLDISLHIIARWLEKSLEKFKIKFCRKNQEISEIKIPFDFLKESLDKLLTWNIFWVNYQRNSEEIHGEVFKEFWSNFEGVLRRFFERNLCRTFQRCHSTTSSWSSWTKSWVNSRGIYERILNEKGIPRRLNGRIFREFSWENARKTFHGNFGGISKQKNYEFIMEYLEEFLKEFLEAFSNLC